MRQTLVATAKEAKKKAKEMAIAEAEKAKVMATKDATKLLLLAAAAEAAAIVSQLFSCLLSVFDFLR